MSTDIVIGIDLGTTNSTLSSASLDDDAAPSTFLVPQVLVPGEVATRDRFPSYLYFPSTAEATGGAFSLPFAPRTDGDVGPVLGLFAEKRAAEAPGRVISSSKSWLCHAGIDRKGAILPLESPDDVVKRSPVDAAKEILSGLRAAWDAAHPDTPMASLDVVVTVPASFDAVARDLTKEAALLAGIGPNLTLLEEPQAAFYAWLAAQGDGWRKQLSPGDTVLVVDIGGGTTDFSLIAVHDDGGNLSLERVATGEHILLGGDNMDLALAWRVRQRLESEGKKIDDWQLRGLMHSCRAAKESLLSDETVASAPVAVPGRGSKLIGGTLRADVTRADITESLVDGFFPTVAHDARPAERRRTALTTLGLPYAQDAAVTKHLAAFLAKTPGAGGAPFAAPSAILMNGGVTRSPLLVRRIVDVVSSWTSAIGAAAPRVLEGADADRAVSRGAAHYARVRRGKGIRIKSGLSRAYYVGIERAELAVPGMPPRVDAVCIAPMGMEEGSSHELPLDLGLYVGEAASFRVFSSSRADDKPADVVDLSTLDELPAIEATLDLAGTPKDTIVPVKLGATVTATGTLEIAARHTTSDKRWRLEFDVRHGA
jgi:molecular chaperone DnaK (HSP70)